MAGLFEELKRRNVIRVAILYVVTAWLMLQAADVGMSALDLPDWTGKFVMFLLALGFPIALIFSWIYELTPEGIKRESEIDRSESITSHTAHRINLTIGVLLVVAIAVVVADRLIEEEPAAQAPAVVPAAGAPEPAQQVDDKSVAVLPFANMSGNPDEDYFSDGMTEEILNVLAKSTSLKVAARTSVFKFKGQGGDIRKIGEELGVGHVIEGSVRRDGERIRVTAQLIRVDDGFHVWSETYDRELKSVFAIQDDIARRIAGELQATLEVGQAAGDRPDVDPRAYDDYLKGRALYRARQDIARAVAHFERAVREAPEMASGWASLCLALEVAHWFLTPLELEALGDVLDRMRQAAGRAAELEPGGAMTLHALANVSRASGAYGQAERLYLKSIAADPTYPDVREDYAEFLFNMGYIGESLVAARELVELEPLVWVFWGRVGDVGAYWDRSDLTAEFSESVQKIDPTAVFGLLGEFQQSFVNGRYEEARAAMEAAYREDPASIGPERTLFLWSLGETGIDDEVATDAIEQNRFYSQYAIPRGDADLFFRSIAVTQAPQQRYAASYPLFMPIAAAFVGDPRATQLLREYGYEAYWRQRGWPANCRPLDEDDFECGPVTGSRP